MNNPTATTLSITPSILDKIRSVRKQSFLKTKTEDDIFYDLCFALCAPQTKFTYNTEVNQKLRDMDFFHSPITMNDLKSVVKKVRFYTLKAERLALAKEKWGVIYGNVRRTETNSKQKRMWLIENVKGCGPKVASHFLRNIGMDDLAIIDTHFLKFMNCEKPRNFREYVAVEKAFEEIAKKNGLLMVELDMYLWKVYSNTEWENYTI